MDPIYQPASTREKNFRIITYEMTKQTIFLQPKFEIAAARYTAGLLNVEINLEKVNLVSKWMLENT